MTKNFLSRDGTTLNSTPSAAISLRRLLLLLLPMLSVGCCLLAVMLLLRCIHLAQIMVAVQSELPYIPPKSLSEMQLQWIDTDIALTAAFTIATQLFWVASQSIKQRTPLLPHWRKPSSTPRHWRLATILFFYISSLLALLYGVHLLLGMITILTSVDAPFAGSLFAIDHTHDIYFWLPLALFTGNSVLAVLLLKIRKQQANAD